jgi:YfiH family protein
MSASSPTPLRRLVTPQWLVPDWPAPPTVRALSTLRVGGASRPPYASLNLGDHVGDAAMAIAKNRRSLREAAGLPVEPSWLSQVHGTRVADLDLEEDSPAAADAAITRQAGRVCAVLTADCLPVLLTSESGDRVAAAHAGWRGLAGGVIEATVQALKCPPRQLLAWLGPAIGPRHFEIGAEVREELLRSEAAGDDPSAEAAFQLNDRGRFMADLYALAKRRLDRLGVERIYGGGECTHADADKYFSHRRDGTTGRQASLIWLERRC